jgi:hypothetical protein
MLGRNAQIFNFSSDPITQISSQEIVVLFYLNLNHDFTSFDKKYSHPKVLIRMSLNVCPAKLDSFAMVKYLDVPSD